MAVSITEVLEKSYAAQNGIIAGDILLKINGYEITDILDYRFFETESYLKLELMRQNEPYTVEINKGQYSAIGLEFETYLMDEQRSCKNNCIFCFIDQLPKGMRKTLYFKDDDERLSFIFGNYITLTNISDKEIDRIIKMRISPINISVHTMNPVLRCWMMRNRFAGDSLRYLYKLAEAGIKLNCQIVLCPGINDGEELRLSLSEFFKLGDNILSVACVPVGLSAHREGLYQLNSYNEQTAGEVIDIIEEYGEKFIELRSERVVYPSDEFYLIAKRNLPKVEFYEDFPQIENGVGMLMNLKDEFDFALSQREESNFNLSAKRAVTSVTGEAAADFLNIMLDELRAKCDNLTIDVIAVHNDFFGGMVDVAGLVTGGDIIKTLSGRELGDELLVPKVMLKSDEDIFLDDVTLEDVGKKLNIKVRKVENNAEALIAAILGEEEPENNYNWQSYER